MANTIVVENALPGNTGWDVDQSGSTNIEGFATDISVNHGNTVNFKINTDAAYHIEIYRLGYYGGDGARLVHQINGLVGTSQPEPVSNPTTGLVDAGNWTVSAQWAIPADAVSGVYIAKIVREDGTGDAQIPFIVRADESHSDIVFQTSDTTWQAYNSWGSNHDALGQNGANFYPEGGGGGGPNDIGPGTGSFGPGRAYEISYNRPIVTRDGGDAAGPWDYVFGAEYSAIFWLEQNGYDVSYIAGVDTARFGSSLLPNHKVFLSVGHDEYWSADQRANVEAARDAGVNLAFFSGNEVYWKTRWETSYLSDGTAFRTLVCYKETWANGDIDPSNEWTGTWRDPRFVSATALGGGNPENALTGTIFYVDSYRSDAIAVPQEMTQLRFWRNTDIAADNQNATLTPNILGYEWDASPDNGFRPAGLIPLSSTTINVNSLLLDFGNTVGPGTATHNLTLYKAPSGALVFGAGTVYWSWGLGGDYDVGTGTPPDINIQQATVNLFADMGVQPGSLQPGLVLATASTDVTAPTTTVGIVGSPTTVTEGQLVTITGTATDNDGNPGTDDGRVAAIEVSTDGGATWRLANGTTNWTYSWTATDPGDHEIMARAIDDSVNLQTANIPSEALTVTASPTSRLFADGDPVAAGAQHFPEPSELELGVRFFSSSNGYITDLLFYKPVEENETNHVGHLWAANGALLATVTFDGETASGWQTATMDTPFAITADTVYVASYHSFGDYYASNGYFNTMDHVSGSLTAPSTVSINGPNGVYFVGVDGFPTSSFEGSNYWVDVVFNLFTGPNNPPEITSDGGGDTATVSIAENSTLVTMVQATDPDTGQTPTYSIVAGADSALFSINPTSGQLTFLAAPDFEAPGDANVDNVYEVTVRASDQFDPTNVFDEQLIAVSVTDVVENVDIGFDGKTVHGEWLWDTNPGANPPGQLGGSPRDVLVVDGVGPELAAFPEQPGDPGVIGNNGRGLADIDIEASRITFTFPIDQTLYPGQALDFSNRAFNGPRISDLHGLDELRPIVGVSISSQGSFTNNGAGSGVGVDPEDIIFDENSIYVYLGGEQRSDGAFLILDVTFANAAPTITSNGGDAAVSITVDENATAVTTVAATDADAVDTKTFSIIGGEEQGLFTINAATGVLTLVSPFDFESLPNAGTVDGYQVQVQVADAYEGIDPQLITVNVADQNDNAPVITTAATQSLAENSTFIAALTTTDLDTVGTNPATFSITGGPDQALFDIVGGNLVFTAPRNYETDAHSYQVEVTANDGTNTSSQAIAVTITNVSGNITGTPDADALMGTAEEDIINGLAGDDALTGGGGNDAIDGGLGSDRVIFSGARSQYEVARVAGGSIRVTDQRAGSPDGIDTVLNVELFQFTDASYTPSQFNNAPQITLPLGASVQATTKGQVFQGSQLFTASDIDTADTLTYAVVDFSPGGGNFIINGQPMSGNVMLLTAAQLAQTTFQAGLNGATDNLRFGVNDTPGATLNSAGWVTQDFSVTAPVNHAPTITLVAGANVQATSQGQVFQLSELVTASDVDNDTLTYAVVDSTPGGGNFRINGQPISGNVMLLTAAQLAQTTFQAGLNGSTDSLRFGVNDTPGATLNSAGWVTQDFTVSAPVNHAPQLNLLQGAAVQGSHGQVFQASDLVSASDANNDPLTYAVVDFTPGGGNFIINGQPMSGNVMLLTAAQLAQTSFQAGLSGTDQLRIGVNDTPGATLNSAGWVTQDFSVSGNHAPQLTLVQGATVQGGHGEVFQASELVSASDADNDTLTFALVDSTPGGGNFFINGQPMAGNVMQLTAAQLAQTTFQASLSGTDQLRIGVNDTPGATLNSAGWVTKDFSVSGNRAPTITLVAGEHVQATSQGQVFQASELFTASDLDNDTLTFAIVDFSPAGSSGRFFVNGQPMAGNVMQLTAAQLAQTTFQSGVSGTDLLRFGVNDTPGANLNSAGWVTKDFDVSAWLLT